VSTASWIPSQEAERLPEIRHNLRLLVSSAKSDLDGLAREARILKQRKKWVRDEDVRLKKIVETEARCASASFLLFARTSTDIHPIQPSPDCNKSTASWKT
jgi:hypothetical protein